MLFCQLVAISVYLHNTFDTVFVRCVNEYTEQILVVSQNVVCGSADDYTATLIGNSFDYFILCYDCTLDNVGAQIQTVGLILNFAGV